MPSIAESIAGAIRELDKAVPFPGLYHFSLPQTVGAGGSPSCGLASCGGTSECLEGSLLAPSRSSGTSECLKGSLRDHHLGQLELGMEAYSPATCRNPASRNHRREIAVGGNVFRRISWYGGPTRRFEEDYCYLLDNTRARWLIAS